MNWRGGSFAVLRFLREEAKRAEELTSYPLTACDLYLNSLFFQLPGKTPLVSEKTELVGSGKMDRKADEQSDSGNDGHYAVEAVHSGLIGDVAAHRGGDGTDTEQQEEVNAKAHAMEGSFCVLGDQIILARLPGVVDETKQATDHNQLVVRVFADQIK